jgi:transcription antitermination factor NusG
MPSIELGRWYVVHAKSHQEEVVQFHLERRGLIVFFPRLFIPQPSPNHPQIVPLFPNYLFVQIREPAEYDYMRWSPGVKYVVNFNGTPVPVDGEIVTFLKERATPKGILTVRSALVVKQEVGDRSESVARLVSIFQNPHDSRCRVKVLMQLLGG